MVENDVEAQMSVGNAEENLGTFFESVAVSAPYVIAGAQKKCKSEMRRCSRRQKYALDSYGKHSEADYLDQNSI